MNKTELSNSDTGYSFSLGLAALAEAGEFYLVGGKSKVATLCECLQALFECGVFGEGNACPAVTARGMVMVFVKGLAELQPIFPSSGYTHNDVEVLKDFASTVHAGAVNAWTCGD